MKKRVGLLCMTMVLLADIGTANENGQLDSEIAILVEARLYSEARKKLQKVDATEQDYGVAQRLLGELIEDGYGGERNPVVALERYREAAKAGDAEAAYRVGLAYEKGDLVPQSAEAAFTWYEKGALHSPSAAFRYAEIALANAKTKTMRLEHEPMERLEYAAESGIDGARYLLGRLLLNGWGVDQDRETGMMWLEEAAKSMPEAKSTLAIEYHKDSRFLEAKTLFIQASNAADTNAYAYLGHYKEFGIAGSVDKATAMKLYSKAGDVAWAVEGKRRLEEQGKSIEMFGLHMYGSTRKDVREHFVASGIERLGGEEYFDAFDVSKALGGRESLLTVAYAPGSPEFVGEINYRFENEDRKAGRTIYEELLKSLSQEYGDPDESYREKGERRVRWIKGNTRILLATGLKEGFVGVTYNMTPYYSSLRDYVESKLSETHGSLKDGL